MTDHPKPHIHEYLQQEQTCKETLLYTVNGITKPLGIPERLDEVPNLSLDENGPGLLSIPLEQHLAISISPH
jgi:hypothetical protein